MVLGKISAELVFDGHWSSLLGKNIYLNTSNTCSWRIMHCIKTLAGSPAGTPHPTYIGRAGSHTYTGIHTRDLPNKLACTGLPYWLGLGGFALESYYCVQILH